METIKVLTTNETIDTIRLEQLSERKHWERLAMEYRDNINQLKLHIKYLETRLGELEQGKV